MSESTPQTATVTLFGYGTGVAQTIRPANTDHVIKVDGTPAFGGDDDEPSWLDYALVALMSSTQVTAQLVAKEMGVVLASFEFEARATLGTILLTTGPSGAAAIDAVTLHAVIATDATPEQFTHLQRETERRCAVHGMFSASGITLGAAWTKVSAV